MAFSKILNPEDHRPERIRKIPKLCEDELDFEDNF